MEMDLFLKNFKKFALRLDGNPATLF